VLDGFIYCEHCIFTHVKSLIWSVFICILIASTSVAQDLNSRLVRASEAFTAGDFTLAAGLLEADLPILKDTLGAYDTTAVPIFEILCAAAYDSLGNQTKALSHYHSCFNVYKHHQLIQNQYYLSSLSAVIGFYSRASISDSINRYQSIEEKSYDSAYKNDRLSFAVYLNDIGVNRMNDGNYNGAIGYLERAYIMFQEVEGEGSQNKAICANSLAIVFAFVNQVDNYKKYYSETIEFFGQKKLLNELFYPISSAFDEYRHTSSNETLYNALMLNRELLKSFKGRFPAQYSESCKSLFRFLRNSRDVCQGLEYLSEAFSIDTSLFNGAERASLVYDYMNLGRAYRDCGHFDKSLQVALLNYQISEKFPIETSMRNQIKLDLSLVYDKVQQYGEAEVILKSLLKEADRGSIFHLSMLDHLATHYVGTSEYVQAKDTYEKKLKLYLKIGQEKDEVYGITLGMYAYALGRVGEFQESEKNFQKSIEVLSAVRSKSLNVTRSNQADIYRLLGRFKKSILVYQKILNNEGLRKDLEASAQNNIGICYLLDGQLANAEKFLMLAKSNLKKAFGINTASFASNCANMGRLKFLRGDMEGALHEYTQAINIQTSVLPKNSTEPYITGTHLGVILFNLEKYQDAIELYDLLIEKQKSVFGRVLIEKETILTSKANCLVALGKPEKAKICFKEAIDEVSEKINRNFKFLSEKQQQLFFEKHRTHYEVYYSFVAGAGKHVKNAVGEMFNMQINNKGLLLRSSTKMRRTVLESGQKELINIYNSWIDINKTLNGMQTNPSSNMDSIVVCSDNCEKLEKLLLSKLGSGFDNFGSSRTWKDLQKEMDSDECVVEFVHFKMKGVKKFNDSIIYHALLLTKEMKEPVLVRLFNQIELQSLLGYAGNDRHYVNSIYGGSQKIESGLYNLIWSQIEDHLAGIKKIRYSPSGLLHKVSLSGLRNEVGAYLSDQYELSCLLNIGSTESKSAMALTKNEKYFLVGGVDYNQQVNFKMWGFLQGSEDEVNQIHEQLKSQNVKPVVLMGSSATEVATVSSMQEASFIHVATHGFFYPDQSVLEEIVKEQTTVEDVSFRGSKIPNIGAPLVSSKNPLVRSGIALGNANEIWNSNVELGENDGVLTALEVMQLDLRKTKLVVLSACETGLGDIVGSEGVYGLQRSFKMAGAEYLIMSLWQVPDKETQEFMTLFYAHLNELKTIEGAFAKTQELMRKKYDPYFWAAFVLFK